MEVKYQKDRRKNYYKIKQIFKHSDSNHSYLTIWMPRKATYGDSKKSISIYLNEPQRNTDESSWSKHRASSGQDILGPKFIN